MCYLRLRKTFSILIKCLSPLALISLISCSGTRLGQELENSFTEPVNSSLTNQDLLDTETLEDELVDISQPFLQQTIQVEEETFAPQIELEQVNQMPDFTPQPYRITIKLSGANPYDPAATVTQALINAGVMFEVESIERIQDQSSRRILPIAEGIR